MHSKNLNRQADFAKFIGMPYIGLHSPADFVGQKIVQDRMNRLMEEKGLFLTLQEVCDALKEFPEIQNAVQDPAIWVGHPDSYTGKVVVMFNGVTASTADVYNTFLTME